MSDTGDYGEVFGTPGSRPIGPNQPPRVSKKGARGRARTLSDFLGNLSERDINEALGRSPRPAPPRSIPTPRAEESTQEDDNLNPQLSLFDDEFSQISDLMHFESSRCSAARYHFADRVLLVSWANGKTPWMYTGVDKETFFTFVSAPSKGKFVNAVLNSYAHGPVAAEYAHLI